MFVGFEVNGRRLKWFEKHRIVNCERDVRKDGWQSLREIEALKVGDT